MKARSRALKAQRDLVGFRLGQTSCAVPLVHVKQVVNPTPLTDVPGAPRGFAGFANHRGLLIPVLHTRDLIESEAHDENLDPNARPKWVLVDVQGSLAALHCDVVAGVIGLESNAGPPGVPQGGYSPFVERVTSWEGRPLLVLDVPGLAPLLRQVGVHPSEILP